MKIGYRKCFNLGNYENEVIFIESEVPDGDDFTPAFENMKNAVENLHRRSLEIDTEHSESEKEEEERRKAENPCYGCEKFGKCDMPMYNRVRCFQYKEESDLPW